MNDFFDSRQRYLLLADLKDSDEELLFTQWPELHPFVEHWVRN